MYDHATESPEVIMYMDRIIKEDDCYRFVGWIAHLTERITSLRIKDIDLACEFMVRQDVLSVYPTLPTQHVGVDFRVPNSLLKERVTVITSSSSAHTIGCMMKCAVFNSGFQESKRSVVVVDNFYSDPDLVRYYAMNNLTFLKSGYHKGSRSQGFIIDGTKEKFEEIMGRKITNWDNPTYANGVFQFCTADDPIVYHCDSQTYAGAIYLTPDAPLRSGTSTYKSRITGATRFDPEEHSHEKYAATFSAGGADFNFYDNSTLEIVDSIANVYNRLVIWDGRAIHAGNGYFGGTIENSRFFQLFFFDLA
jgi:hypothetical protein